MPIDSHRFAEEFGAQCAEAVLDVVQERRPGCDRSSVAVRIAVTREVERLDRDPVEGDLAGDALIASCMGTKRMEEEQAHERAASRPPEQASA